MSDTDNIEPIILAARLTLICDDRERAVSVHYSAEDQAKYTIVKKRITTGDYAIVYQGMTLAIIERKTLSDYAASLKDGRSNNKANLFALRDTADVQRKPDIYYIVEGRFPKGADTNKISANPRGADTSKIGGIPYSTIVNSMTNLMVRDHIFVIQTDSSLHTSRRILDLINSYRKHVIASIPAPLVVGGDAVVAAADIPEVLTIPHEITLVSIKRDMLMALPYIGPVAVEKLMQYSIADMCCNGVCDRVLKGISKKIKETLHLSQDNLNKMLSACHGVSWKSVSTGMHVYTQANPLYTPSDIIARFVEKSISYADTGNMINNAVLARLAEVFVL